MSIQSILNQLPQYAYDIDRNIREMFHHELKTLEKYQLFGIALTVGYALRNESLLNYIRPEAKNFIDGNEAHACKIAATTIAMTGMYNNFRYNIKDRVIKKMPSTLSQDNLTGHSVDRKDFLIYCLTASIVYGSKYCMDDSIDNLKRLNCSIETIRDIAKTASVIKATGDVLEIERMRSYEFIVREESF